MPTTFEIPRLASLARHALPNIVEATLAPLALFYLAMWTLGVWGALLASLAWSYTALGVRLVRGKRIPGILVLGALAMTARTVIAAASGSVFVYFLQPSLGTVTVAGAFLLSVPAGRPLAERLTHDFCPMPEAFSGHPALHRAFRGISLLWGFVYLTNASLTIWLLLSQSLGVFLLAKTVVSMALTAAAVGGSTWWFVRRMRAEGIQVVRSSRLPRPPSVVPAAAG